ncbi:MAG: esterase/lipase family protein [Gammaproteobacteria bacterium]
MPVVVVPGVLGSRLVARDTGREVWPGSTTRLLTSSYRELALTIDPATLEPLDDGLIPSGLFDAAAGRDFYRSVLHALEQAGGYQPGRPGVQEQDGIPRYYPFPYDWRQDNVATVRRLDALIEQIRRDYGDPRLRVDVIAHSMGGLILRYYERYGTADGLDDNMFPVTGAGAMKLRRVVLLGTPNQGSVTAVHSFLNGYRVGLASLPTEAIATMPALYQLFPHPLVDWIMTADGQPLSRDLFSVELWRHFQWSVFDPRVRRRIEEPGGAWPDADTFERWFEKRLERARRFVWSLIVPVDGVQLVTPLVFSGNCVPTPARLVVEEAGGDSVVRLRPEQILNPVPGVDYERLMFEPGDGSVTKSSLLGRQELDPSVPRHEYAHLEFEQAFFICEEHGALTANLNLLDNLLHHLLRADPAPQ